MTWLFNLMEWLTNLSPEEWTAVRLSVRVATVATLVSLPLGIAVAPGDHGIEDGD